MDITTTLKISAGILGMAAAATFLLPRHVYVERSAFLQTTPDAVLALAASHTGYQAFNPYRTADPELKIERFGPESGVGSGFSFDGKEGKGTQIVAHVSNTSVRYVIDLGTLGKPNQTIKAIPMNGGTEVTWSVDSDMGFNPLFRIFGLFMDGMMGEKFEQGLANLAETAA